MGPSASIDTGVRDGEGGVGSGKEREEKGKRMIIVKIRWGERKRRSERGRRRRRHKRGPAWKEKMKGERVYL